MFRIEHICPTGETRRLGATWVERARREKLFRAELLRNYVLIDGELDACLERPSISVDSERKRVANYASDFDDRLISRRKVHTSI
jgi:hypothetical protein